ncbi:hypothetical protein ACFE04_014600 [Oxalis oulophora]
MADSKKYRKAPSLPLHNNDEPEKSTRRVSFTAEVHHSGLYTCSSSPRVIDERDAHHRRTRPWFCKFWAWTCLVLCILSFAFLIVGASFYAIVRSGLPDVYLKRVSFPIVNVDKSNQIILSAAADVVLEFYNDNENSNVIFGSMNVDVYGEHTKLGQANIPEFSLGPKNLTILIINSTIVMDETGDQKATAAPDIESSLENKKMVIDVILNGQIGFDASGFKFKGLPVKIQCKDVKQSDLELGNEPECPIKIIFG